MCYLTGSVTLIKGAFISADVVVGVDLMLDLNIVKMTDWTH